MSTLSIRIPDSVHETVKKLANEDNISINQFISSAVIEKITAMKTEDSLASRAAKGNSDSMKNILDLVPDVSPEKHDI